MDVIGFDPLDLSPTSRTAADATGAGSFSEAVLARRSDVLAQAETVVVKVGTRVLRGDAVDLDIARIESLAAGLSAWANTGRRVLLVSSGAVGAGMGRLGLTSRPTDVATLQAVAAIGQARLMQAYDRAFATHGRPIGQVLLVAGDLDKRDRYLNVRNTLRELHRVGAIPIINENDTVAVDELAATFGDNDQLAALVTTLVGARLLVILSDVDGLYDRDPSDPEATVIPEVPAIDESVYALVRDKKTGLSKGGMASKLKAASIVTGAGGATLIASGRDADVLTRILDHQPVGTLFLPGERTIEPRKRWLGYSARPKGSVLLDDGAVRAIRDGGKSLLAIGIRSVVGDFQMGDVIVLRTEGEAEIARGLANFSSFDLRRIVGLTRDQIAAALGHVPHDCVVHRNNLLVTAPIST